MDAPESATYPPPVVFLRVQYPDTIGPVARATLSELLEDISSDTTVTTTNFRHAMTLFQWSLGARISGKPCSSDSELSKQENTGKMIPLIVSDGEPYFCQSQPATAPAGEKIDPTQFVTIPNTPTILVEMWHNLPNEVGLLKKVIDRICYHVQSKLAPTSTSDSTTTTSTSIKPWVYLMQYTLEANGTSKNACKGFMCTS